MLLRLRGLAWLWPHQCSARLLKVGIVNAMLLAVGLLALAAAADGANQAAAGSPVAVPDAGKAAPAGTGPATGDAHAPVAVPSQVAPAQVAPAQVAPAQVEVTHIDPTARQLMDKMVAAHKDLKSFSCTMELVAHSGTHESKTLAKIVFARPNRIALRVQEQGPAATSIVSNGKTLFVSLASDAKRYLKVAAPTGPTAISDVLAGIRNTGPGLVPLASGQDPLAKMSPALKSLTMEAPEVVDGIPVEVVTAELAVAQNTLSARYFMARDDHLLRRLIGTFTRAGGAPPVVLTETYHDLKVNPALPASTFAFSPPTGAIAVTELEPPGFDPRLKVGTRPFAFAVKDTAGKPISLEQYKGKVVLLDFWATWCGPCLEEVPNVTALYRKYQSRGFDIVGISLDEDYSSLSSFTTLHHMPWRQIFDSMGPQGQVPTIYSVNLIPFTLLVDREGKIAAVNARGPALQRAVEKVMAGGQRKRRARANANRSARSRPARSHVAHSR